jgi:hypothetical protein
MDNYTLLVFPETEYIKELYQSKSFEDGQFQLIIPEPITFSKFETKIVDFKIKCKLLSPNNKPCNFIVSPLPSIAYTPLFFNSSLIVFNSSIENNISIPIKNLNSNNYTLETNILPFQILAPNFSPLNIIITDIPTKTNKIRLISRDEI